ncbi:unnamed protein product [Closterium sp. NIES-54]
MGKGTETAETVAQAGKTGGKPWEIRLSGGEDERKGAAEGGEAAENGGGKVENGGEKTSPQQQRELGQQQSGEEAGRDESGATDEEEEEEDKMYGGLLKLRMKKLSVSLNQPRMSAWDLDREGETAPSGKAGAGGRGKGRGKGEGEEKWEEVGADGRHAPAQSGTDDMEPVVLTPTVEAAPILTPTYGTCGCSPLALRPITLNPPSPLSSLSHSPLFPVPHFPLPSLPPPLTPIPPPLPSLLSLPLSPPSLLPAVSVRSAAHSPRHYSPSLTIRSGLTTPMGSARGSAAFMVDQMVGDAWDVLRRSLVLFRGKPVGTIAAMDNTESALNYDQVFVRDFVPSALAFLINGEHSIVENFLLKTLRLQAWEKRVDVFTLGEGVMPASFKVMHDPNRGTDTMIADFGESAIGRVAPVDSGFWWIFLLRAYVKATGDQALADSPDCQRGMRLILELCLADGFDTFPTLLCADGCCMIDRRMGIYGYPIEIQSLFYMALRVARSLLRADLPINKDLLDRIDKRLIALTFHMRTYFWLDHEQLNSIYRYKTEEYSHTAVNKFNVIPDSIPDWLFDFMPLKGGYFIGNVSPARMDFRWFTLGNCIAILSCMATSEQAAAIMDLIEERWDELIGEMPLKVTYPALEGHEWRITTGCDPKNTRWSYHNGGSWPVLLWMLTAASIKVGRPHVARRAIDVAEKRISRDNWPEYYDGKLGRYVGKQARKQQTWSVAGYLVAKMMLEDPSHLGMVALEEEKMLQQPVITRSHSWKL